MLLLGAEESSARDMSKISFEETEDVVESMEMGPKYMGNRKSQIDLQIDNEQKHRVLQSNRGLGTFD